MHDPWIQSQGANSAESTAGRDIIGRIGKSWGVQRIEDLPAKDQLYTFVDRSGLNHNDVKELNPGINPSVLIQFYIIKVYYFTTEGFKNNCGSFLFTGSHPNARS